VLQDPTTGDTGRHFLDPDAIVCKHEWMMCVRVFVTDLLLT
jgi:hypothetical protein